MPALRRFAPLIAIVALLFLVAVGGAALANNSQTPDIDPRTATVNVGDDTRVPETTVGDDPATSGSRSPEEGTGDAAEDAPAQAPAPAQEPGPAPAPAPAPAPQPQYQAPAPAPQPPLNYQYYDDDWDDDDWDDDGDWDDDDWDD